jgi:hypothetical protein
MSLTIQLTKPLVKCYKAAKKDSEFQQEYFEVSGDQISESFPSIFNTSDGADVIRLGIACSYSGWLIGKNRYTKDMFQ